MDQADHNLTDGERFEEFVGLVSSLEKEVQRIRAVECERLGLRGADLMCLYCAYRVPVSLTDAGRATMRGVDEAVSRVMSRVDSALDDEARTQLYASLASVLECLRGIGR